QALEHYFNSGLPEIEFPLYIEALEARGEITEAIEWQKALKGELILQVRLLIQMESDSVFMKNMPAMIEDSHFVEWENQ
ncbi:hypothetical protein THIOM_003278, partial [Candidatus Thiomargarita nelsonii]